MTAFDIITSERQSDPVRYQKRAQRSLSSGEKLLLIFLSKVESSFLFRNSEKKCGECATSLEIVLRSSSNSEPKIDTFADVGIVVDNI